MKWWLLLSVLLVCAGLYFSGILTSTERPKMDVLMADGPYSLRAYPPMITAEVSVKGDRATALTSGFKKLANYIFGDNQPGQQKIAMTAPVAQKIAMTSPVGQQAEAKDHEKIAMTAPVGQQAGAKEHTWMVRFIMPASYTMASLPKPNDSDIAIVAHGERRYVAMTFSGHPNTAMLEENTQALKQYALKKGWVIRGEPIYQYYNPPWILPFMRENDVMFEVDAGD
jgi:hypothetical protein